MRCRTGSAASPALRSQTRGRALRGPSMARPWRSTRLASTGMTDPRSLTPRFPALKLLIDGKSVDPVEGTTLPVVNPATGVKLVDAPAASARDVDLAVQSARRAFDRGPWPRLNARER